MTVTFYLTLVVFIALCAIFALLILIQKGRGGGISSAFGGAGGNTAFGTKTGDVLTWATSAVFLLFLGFCVLLNWMAAGIVRQQTGIAAGPGANEATQSVVPASQPAVVPAVPNAGVPDAPAQPDVATPLPTTQP